MNYTQDIFKDNKLYFIGLFLFVFISLGCIQYFGRDELHVLLNGYNTPFLDVFFKYFSKYGPVVFILCILYYVVKRENYKVLFILLSSYLLNFIVVTFVKKVFFIHVHRPTYYFSEKGIDLHLIDGVSSQIPFTFPSGHTSEAFLLLLFVCILSTSKWIHFISICIAVIMAYSRVYLSKHFLIDTVGGSLLGVFIVTLLFYVFQHKNSTLLDRKILK